jgi:hypothetical protein
LREVESERRDPSVASPAELTQKAGATEVERLVSLHYSLLRESEEQLKTRFQPVGSEYEGLLLPLVEPEVLEVQLAKEHGSWGVKALLRAQLLTGALMA